MSIFAKLSDEALALLKGAGHMIEEVALGAVDEAIAYAKTNEPLVTTTLNLISDLMSKELAGEAKMSALIDDIKDEFATFVSEGGFQHLVSEGENLVKTFGENLLTG